MNMYAIGQGFAGASQGFAQGLQNQNTIQQQGFNNRLALQKYAMEQEKNQQAMNFAAQDQEMKMQQYELQIKALQDKQNQTTVYNAFNGYLSDGDTRWFNTPLQEDPAIRKLSGGVSRIDKFNLDDPQDVKLLQTSGIPDVNNPDALKRFVKATYPDGSQKLFDIHGLALGSGAWKQMNDERISNTLKEAQAAYYMGKAYTAENPQLKPTADMQNAQYFSQLKVKIDNNNATPEEVALYDTWLTKQGGAQAANQVILNKESANMQDIYKPDFDISLVAPGTEEQYRAFARKLETTPGGKQLTTNIGKQLGDGIGAVKQTAKSLTNLVTQKDVKTSTINEQINKVKAYLPESMRDMTDEDLKDASFRQAYLSAAAVFLKLQSGLTVSDAERERFEASFGTLSKNTKVNMVGLKTKLDETIANYEANKALEPGLYNIKYANTISDMKNTSGTIADYIGGKSNVLTTKQKTDALDKIFGGK